jgi:spore cortex biosynthesis protein YabQ
MNQVIAVELHFFALCILWGGQILLAYDVLRVFRRLIKHGSFIMAVEDLFFWIISGILIFAMIYRQNNGIIRGFAVMGMTAGMLLYNLIMKDHLVNIIVKGIRILIKPFAAALKLIKRYLDYIRKKVENALKVLLKQLKLISKSIKMNISGKHNKRLQKKLQKRTERQKKAEKKAASGKRLKRKGRKADKKFSAGNPERKQGLDLAAYKDSKQLQVHKKVTEFTKLSEDEVKQILLKRK